MTMYPYGITDKRPLNMLILEILATYTDSKHRLRQEEIIEKLNIHYGVHCDRRSIKNNVLSLVQLGYAIPLKGGYCLLERDFEDGELRLLIDCLIFCRTIQKPQKLRMIDKVKKLGNRYFQPKIKHIVGLADPQGFGGNAAPDALDLLNDAIDQKRRVSFRHSRYGADLALHPLDAPPILANPYQILAANDRYYLVANPEGEDRIAYYRIDRMTDVVVLEDKAVPRNLLGEGAKGSRLPRNPAESLVPGGGKEVEVQFRASEEMTGDILDWFGKVFRIVGQEDGEIRVSLRCEEEAMFRWALSYGDKVEVLEPEGLRRRIRETALRMAGVHGE